MGVWGLERSGPVKGPVGTKALRQEWAAGVRNPGSRAEWGWGRGKPEVKKMRVLCGLWENLAFTQVGDIGKHCGGCFFITAFLTSDKIHSFKAYNSVDFSTFTELCNHHHNQF